MMPVAVEPLRVDDSDSGDGIDGLGQNSSVFEKVDILLGQVSGGS